MTRGAGGSQNVGRLREGHCDRHQDPLSINGHSHGQMGSGNHTGIDHFDFDWIYHLLDHQCPHGRLAHEDVVDVKRIGS